MSYKLVNMKYVSVGLVCFLLSSYVSCESNSTEHVKSKESSKPLKTSSQVKAKPKSSTKSQDLSQANTGQAPHLPDLNPGLVTLSGNQKLLLDPRYDTISYSSYSDQPQSDHKFQKVSDGKGNRPGLPNQNLVVLQNGRRFELEQTPFQQDNPYLNTAIGAISAQILSQRNQDYIPYPPNGNPADFPGYRGQPYPGEPPLIGAYERANGAGYGTYANGKIENRDPNAFYPPHFGQFQDFSGGQFDQFGMNYYHPQMFGQFGFYPNVQTNFARNDRDREMLAGRRNDVTPKEKEPIK